MTTKTYKGKTVLNTVAYANGTAHLILWGAHSELGAVHTYDNGQSETAVLVRVEG